MKVSRALLAVTLTLWGSSAAYPQTPKPQQGRDAPDFTVQVWGDVAADYSTRLSSYVELRSQLEMGLPVRQVTDDAARIGRRERALAEKIRTARGEARQGDLFTPPISVQFKRVLLLEMSPDTWASIMDDNPGEFRIRING